MPLWPIASLSCPDTVVDIQLTANDKYWGDGGDGTGKNMLGKSLEIVRNELRVGNLLPAWSGAV